MSHRITIGCGLLLAGLFVVSAGCPQHPPRIYMSSIDAAGAGRTAIEMYDANKDGKLTGEELDKCPGLKAAAARLDPSGQGVTAGMIAAEIKQWQETQSARLSVHCRVLRKGKALEGAEVRLVPEAFLGGNVAVATGHVDLNGFSTLSVPVSGERYDPPGVHPGFYRIEITKPGLSIPAKYNTETILGVEVFYDSPAMTEGVNLNLEF